MATSSVHERLRALAMTALCISIMAALTTACAALAGVRAIPGAGLLPAENLVRGLQLPVRLNLADAGISEGLKAVDFTLSDISGSEVSLSELLSEKPAVLILGSYT